MVRDEKNKHRPMKYHVDEMIVRFRGYKNMRMLLRGMPYVFKPVIIGLIPQSMKKVSTYLKEMQKTYKADLFSNL